MPYGQSPPAQAPGPFSPPDAGLGLGNAFAIIAGGLGVIIYILSFADDASGYLRAGLLGIMLLGGGLLAAASALPQAPATVVPATVLVVTATLFLFIDVVKNPVVFLPTVGTVNTPTVAVVALIVALVEAGACVAALLAESGLLKAAPRPSPYQQQSSGPRQPGGHPSPPPDQYGQPGQYGLPGHYRLPGQHGQPGGSYGDQPWRQGQPGGFT